MRQGTAPGSVARTSPECLIHGNDDFICARFDGAAIGMVELWSVLGIGKVPKEFCEEHSSTAPPLLLLLLLGRGEGIFSGGLQLQKCRSDKWYTN